MKIVLIILLVIAGLILLAALYLLFRPVHLVIDTSAGQYYAGWNRWLNVRLTEEEEHWGFRLTMFFYRRFFVLEKMIIQEGKNEEEKKGKKEGKSKGRRFFRFKYVRTALKQVRVKLFYLVVDTDDFVWNAYLFPIMQLIRSTFGMRTYVNFTGNNVLRLHLEASIARVFMAGKFNLLTHKS